MAKKIEISPIRVQQFNKMTDLLRSIRHYDWKKKVTELKRSGKTREEALEHCVREIQYMSTASRGIAELKEVSNG